MAWKDPAWQAAQAGSWEEVRYESNSLQASQLQALLLPWISVAGKNAVIFTIKNTI